MRHIRLYSLINRRQQHKLAAAQSLRRRLTRLGLGCAVFAMLLVAAGMLGLSIAYTSLVDGLPSLTLVPDLLKPSSGLLMQPTRIYDRSGQKLLLSLENPGIPRRYLSVDPGKPDHFSLELVRVTLGAVDPNYWRSPGFSLASLTSPDPVTIPERLVDDLLLWKEPRDLRHALRMRLLAAQIVARYGHVQVLEWYLNSAYYGHLAYSADSAARLYLEKSAAELDLPEAALLAAASQAPALNLLDAPDAAIERQRVVLDSLLAQRIITADEHRRAYAEKIHLAPSAGAEASPAAAFSRQVLAGLAERFGRDRLERGGLKIITTLDYSLQLELTCLARTQLARLADQQREITLPDGSPCESARLLPTLPEGDVLTVKGLTTSAVILNPQNGQVLALIGDTTTSGETNLLTPRAPGSLLTPFVALTGFVRGIGPANLVWDIPASLPEDLAAHPNPDGKFHGPVRLRTALANDYLAPQAQMLEQMGAQSVWRLASDLGLSGLSEERSPDLLYSAGRVSPLEIAQSYSVFASQGIRAGQRLTPGGDLRPAMVLYVEDVNGTPWMDARQPEKLAVLSTPLAYLIHHVLSDAAARWPSLGYPNPLEIGRPSGAKIGQVEGGGQVWTIGYTPQRVIVFSLSLPEDVKEKSLKPRLAAGMWHAMIQYTTRYLPVTDWPEPPGIAHVEVCDPSGLLPTRDCPQVVSEVFLSGSEPSAPDSLYRAFQINRETGRLATVFTPPELIEEKTFLVVPAQAHTWANAAALPLPPEDYDAIQPHNLSPDVHISGPDLFAYVSGKVTIKGTAGGIGLRSYQILAGQGLNPQNWIQIGQSGTTPVADGVLAEWDTQGLEGLYAVRLQVIRQDQAVETATIQVTVDNTAPLVRIPYPVNEQVFQYPQDRSITFQAEASDTIGIQRLVWRLDGTQVGESLQAPYIFTWPASRGEHTLEVRAYDLAGNEGKSEQVHFTVK